MLGGSCACCGGGGDGWYCYGGPCYCICEDPSKILPNVLLFNCVAQSWSPPNNLSGWPNPSTGGNVLLNRVTTGPQCSTTWSGSYVAEGHTITVLVAAQNITSDDLTYGEGVVLSWQGPYTASNGNVYYQPYANTFLTPNGSFSAAAGKSAFKAICDGVQMTTGNLTTYPATIVRGD